MFWQQRLCYYRYKNKDTVWPEVSAVWNCLPVYFRHFLVGGDAKYLTDAYFLVVQKKKPVGSSRFLHLSWRLTRLGRLILEKNTNASFFLKFNNNILRSHSCSSTEHYLNTLIGWETLNLHGTSWKFIKVQLEKVNPKVWGQLIRKTNHRERLGFLQTRDFYWTMPFNIQPQEFF